MKPKIKIHIEEEKHIIPSQMEIIEEKIKELLENNGLSGIIENEYTGNSIQFCPIVIIK